MNNSVCFYQKEITFQQLNDQKINNYFSQIYAGDESAREEFIKTNIPLVLFVVTRYFFNYYECYKEDIIQTGIIGLIKSVDNFDITKGRKFSTFASRCIYNEILIYINHFRLDYTETNLPNTDEGYDFLLKDKYNLLENLEEKDLTNVIKIIIDELSPINKQIINLYFGFSGEPKTQEEIGKILNLKQYAISKKIKTILLYITKRLKQMDIIDADAKLMIEIKPKKSQGRIPSLYTFFKDYSKREIDAMIDELSPNEKNLLIKRNGYDFDNPIPSANFTAADRAKYYNCLVPHMRRILKRNC